MLCYITYDQQRAKHILPMCARTGLKRARVYHRRARSDPLVGV